MGTVSDTDTSPVTYSPASSLPSMSVYRGLYPDEDGNTVSLGYYGLKVDTAELTIEQGADVQLEINFAGKGATIPSALSKPSLDMSLVPFSFYHSSIDVKHPGGQFTAKYATRLQISINNNLEARYASRKVGSDPTPVEIREGPQVITGEFIVDQDVEDFAKDVLRARSEGTLILRIGNDTRGTMDIVCNRVALREFSDTVRGREPYEVSFPFVARCSGPSAYDAIEITYRNTVAGTIHDLPI